MLAVGEDAPDFEGPTADGGRLKLSELRGQPVVVYFFPKAGTLGCTRESLELADRFPALRAAGVHVVGVSVDRAEDLRAFSQRCALPFPLVSDTDKSMARRFGVLSPFGFAKRVTFVLGPEGRVLQVIDALLPGAHASLAAARFLSDRPGPKGTSPAARDAESADYSVPSRSK